MTEIIKYSLCDFNNIRFAGFDYVLDEKVIKIISELALQVGSPDYIKTPNFSKKEFTHVKDMGKKKYGNRNEGVEDWELIRNFQTTNIGEKLSNIHNIDNIRANLNKLTDKNAVEIRNKIINDIDKILEDNKTVSELNDITTTLFDIASLNRFYSEIYADLYSVLIDKYEIIRKSFETNLENFMDLFKHIEYVDPAVDYDKFCKINKNNEKRKSLAAFYKNLCKKKIIPEKKMIEILKTLVSMIYVFISEENRKNEVDELIENVAILYDRTLEDEYENIIIANNLNIMDFLEQLSQSKPTDYKSLTNKTIFKCMDLVEI